MSNLVAIRADELKVGDQAVICPGGRTAQVKGVSRTTHNGRDCMKLNTTTMDRSSKKKVSVDNDEYVALDHTVLRREETPA